MVKKAYILQEIKRTAEANGGKPLGSKRFESETGIRTSDWQKYRAHWNDVIRDAGFSPNELNRAYDDRELLNTYADLALRLGHLPSSSEIRFEARNVRGFPSHNTFRRLGTKSEFVKRLLEHCGGQSKYRDVVRMCEDYVPRKQEASEESAHQEEEIGFVYLNRSGGLYYIGQTNSAGRRTYEHEIRLPGKVEPIHKIPTPNPLAAEGFWQERFAAKRDHGSWYDLDKKDVAAFKKCKSM